MKHNKWLKMAIAAAVVGLVATQLPGCSSSIDSALLDKFHYKNGAQPSLTPTNKGSTFKLDVQYLGVGGYLINYDDYKLLLAPSFSNPSILQLVSSIFVGGLTPNATLVEGNYPGAGKDNPKAPHTNIEAILVGHAHYDHLLDVPYVMKHYAHNAKAYGSNTMRSLLLSEGIHSDRAIALNDKLSHHQYHHDDNWISVNNDRIRFMALKSGHGPLFGPYVLAEGFYDGDELVDNPGVLDYKLGQPLAFVIDFINLDGSIDFRIHYVDSASDTPHGYIPKEIQAQKSVDLAITSLGGFNGANDYPEHVIEHLQAKTIIAGHWEHFFDNMDKEHRVVAGSDHLSFIEKMEQHLPDEGRWIMLQPFSQVSFPTENR